MSTGATDSFSRSHDVIMVQPASSIRRLGNLREKMKITIGQNLIGRSEFEISCSIAGAYAHFPGEEVVYRFKSQSDCKSLLQASESEPCRSRLAIHRPTRTVTVLGKACGTGSTQASGTTQSQDGFSIDEDLSLSERARSVRIRSQTRNAR